jgi:hypothetical protein
MIYPSPNISKRDRAMQQNRERERHAQKHDQKEKTKKKEIAHASNISRREEKIIQKGVSYFRW